jgi:exodeoxyribonuclease-3
VRIVVWNCRMAVAKKRGLLDSLRPDIAVIPECSRDSILACKNDGFTACWWGDNRHKGLGVLAAKPWTIEAGRRPTQKWIAPVRVNGPLNFLLIAVWACPVGMSKEKNYVGQVFEAVTRHPRWFADKQPVVMCGDFNSNAIWDPGRKIRTHTAVVKMLSDKNLFSAYHAFFSEEHGKETRSTYYFWHRKDRCFHLDYIFMPSSWAPHMTDVEVGTYEDWRPSSDHVPIVVDVAEG